MAFGHAIEAAFESRRLINLFASSMCREFMIDRLNSSMQHLLRIACVPWKQKKRRLCDVFAVSCWQVTLAEHITAYFLHECVSQSLT